jgi:trigger factor
MLIAELIKTRGIQSDRSKVEERLLELAGASPDPEGLLKAYRQSPEAMRQVENLVIEDAVCDYLLGQARVADQPSSFREIMNFGA